MPSNTSSPLLLKFTVKQWTETARRLESFRDDRLMELRNALPDVDEWTLYRWCRGLSEPKGLYRAMLNQALVTFEADPNPSGVAFAV